MRPALIHAKRRLYSRRYALNTGSSACFSVHCWNAPIARQLVWPSSGAPKIGKSWLALTLCLCVAKGEPLWSFAAQQCSALYLCLEDSYQRIRCRLLDLTENAPDTLHFSIIAEQLHGGLEQQIERFLLEHPDTGLVVIDTLQRIRGSGDSGNPYANDYRDIGALKALADKHRIAILLVHHIRKLKSDDPMDMISGTNGISGATDTNFVLMKTSRSKSTATLYCTGRDIEYRELNLEFGSETHFGNLLSDNSPSVEQPDGQMLSLLSALLRQQSEISATAATLRRCTSEVCTVFVRILVPEKVSQFCPKMSRFRHKVREKKMNFPATPHLAPVARRVAACGPICGLQGEKWDTDTTRPIWERIGEIFSVPRAKQEKGVGSCPPPPRSLLPTVQAVEQGLSARPKPFKSLCLSPRGVFGNM